MRATPCSDFLQFFDQCSRDSPASMCRCHREIVDVDLAALLFELPELVRCKTTDHVGPLECDQCDERITAQQAAQVALAGALCSVGARVVEGLAEQCQQRIQQRNITRSE